MLDAPERLRAAIVKGNLGIVKRLLARYPELWLNTDPNNNGWCNLHYASYHGHYLVCFHLVSTMRRRKAAPSDIELVTFDNLTVLHMPLQHHHSQTLHYLLQEFLAPRWIDHRGGALLRTPLHYCCMYGFLDGLKLLLEFGADWALQDKNGDTALHVCCSYGDTACLEELVRFVATKRIRGILAASEDAAKFDEAPSEAIRAEIEADLSAYDALLNNKGWRAVDYAALFEIEKNYELCKKRWVERAVEEEIALRNPASWDMLLLLLAYEAPERPEHGLSSALSSFNYTATTRTLLGSDVAVLSSPLNIVAPELPAAPAAATTPDVKTRKHLRSLPGQAPEPQVADRATSRTRSNTSFAFGYRPSPIQVRTPTLAQGAMAAPQTPLPLDFPRTPSLKSVTILPLVRHGKRHDTEGVMEESSDDTLPPDDSSTASSRGSTTPTSTNWQGSHFTFSPLSIVRRRRSTLSAVPTEPQPAARAAAEAAVRSRGLLARVSTTSSMPALSMTPVLRRNVSTPSVLADVNIQALESPNSTKRPIRRTSEVDQSVRPPIIGSYSNGDLTQGLAHLSVTTPTSSEDTTKYVFTIPEGSTGSAPETETSNESGGLRNVKSISFTRVRDASAKA